MYCFVRFWFVECRQAFGHFSNFYSSVCSMKYDTNNQEGYRFQRCPKAWLVRWKSDSSFNVYAAGGSPASTLPFLA